MSKKHQPNTARSCGSCLWLRCDEPPAPLHYCSNLLSGRCNQDVSIFSEACEEYDYLNPCFAASFVLKGITQGE